MSAALPLLCAALALLAGAGCIAGYLLALRPLAADPRERAIAWPCAER